MSLPRIPYHPEPYWSTVAREIAAREGVNVIAGDDEPYYRYKRRKFLSLLLALELSNRSVLEIGPGPGGNLLALEALPADRMPSRLAGCDISSEMLRLARGRLDSTTELFKTDGTSLPFEDGEFQVVFTATVLQHNTDDAMLRALMAEIARVSSSDVVLFEQVGKRITGSDLRLARPIEYYSSIMHEFGFELRESKMIGIVASYFVCGAIRKVFNSRNHREGVAASLLTRAMQKITLPVTSIIDKFIPRELDLAKMHFVRTLRG